MKETKAGGIGGLKKKWVFTEKFKVPSWEMGTIRRWLKRRKRIFIKFWFEFLINSFFFSSVQFSCLVMPDSLLPHGLQHAGLPCPSLSPGVYSDSCPLSHWCHPTILSSIVPFPSCLEPFPGSECFLMSLPFTSGGQSIRASALASVLQMNTQGWFPGSYAILFFTISGFTFTTRHICNWTSFLLWPATSFFLELLVIALCSSPVAYWAPSILGAYLPVS